MKASDFIPMKAVIELTTRRLAMQELAQTRYGQGAEPISNPTLWRWCRACGLSSGRDVFLPHEMSRLHEVAKMLTAGYNLAHVKNHFGD
jgi:hypothetical protein